MNKRIALLSLGLLASLIITGVWRYSQLATSEANGSVNASPATKPARNVGAETIAGNATTTGSAAQPPVYKPNAINWSVSVPASKGGASALQPSDLLRRLRPIEVVAQQTAGGVGGRQIERALVVIDGKYPRVVVQREYASAAGNTVNSNEPRPVHEFAYVADHILVRLDDNVARGAVDSSLAGAGWSALEAMGDSGAYKLSLKSAGLNSVDEALNWVASRPDLALLAEPDFLVTTSEVLGATQVVQAGGSGEWLIDPTAQNWVKPALDNTTPAVYGADVLAKQSEALLATLPEGARVLQFEVPGAPESYRPGIELQHFWTRTLSSDDTSSVYIQNAYTSGYPSNGSNYVRILSSDGGLDFRHKDGLPFTVHSIDIAEYSTVFTGRATVQFTGTKRDGSTVTQTFVTDGVIDGTGPLADFQTFTFPSTFNDLISLKAGNPPYMIDNIVVTLSGQETPLPPPPEAPVIYDVNWDDAASIVNALPPTSGPYAISSINFGSPRVRSAVGGLTSRPLEIIGGGSGTGYGQIRFDLKRQAVRYVLDVDVVIPTAGKSLTIFLDGVGGLIPLDITSSSITAYNVPGLNIPYVAKNVNHLRVEMNHSTNQLKIFLNGTQAFSGTPSNVMSDLNDFRFSIGDSGGTGGVAIDNVRIEAHAGSTAPVSEPRIQTYPASILYFPDATLGSEVSRSVTITNTGTANLVVSSVTSNNAAFKSSTGVIPPIAPGSSFYHNVTFKPAGVSGSITGLLSINTNVPGATVKTITLNGKAQGTPVASINPALLSARIVAGSVGTEFFNITNSGTDALSWSFIRSIGTGVQTPPSPVTTNDTLVSQLWGMGLSESAGINATRAWGTTSGSANVLVAVIDTGIELMHPDLAANIQINSAEVAGNGLDDDRNGYIDDRNGWNFSGANNNPNDTNGHGTHVAGTIAARANNALGVVGVAWSSRVLPIQFLSATGVGYTSDAVLAVNYARNRGARLINASWGGGGYSTILRDAISQFISYNNGLFVAAAGNEGTNNDTYAFYPAGYDLPGIVAVAATNARDNLAYFSNYGRVTVDVAAPGDGVLSTYRGGAYALSSGTSMAAPHVSGALALLVTRNPQLTSVAVKKLLTDYADFPSGLNGFVASDGRVNVWRSLERTMSGWLSPVTTYGTIAPGATSTVTLNVDATQLSTGTYSASLAFQTNDPQRPSIILPVQLLVGTNTAFNQWTRANFAQSDLLHDAIAASTWSANADPDNDKVPNVIEYLLGRSATVAESGAPLLVGVTTESGTTATVQLRIDTADTPWVIEWSPTLVAGSWSSDLVLEEVSRNTAAGTRIVKAKLPVSAGKPERAFFRLRAVATE